MGRLSKASSLFGAALAIGVIVQIKAASPENGPTPRLVLQIAVDQLREHPFGMANAELFGTKLPSGSIGAPLHEVTEP